MLFNESLEASTDPDPTGAMNAIEEDLRAIYSMIFVGFAGFTILIYDHFITFADEVGYFWRGRRSFYWWLFLTLRYSTPLGFVVRLYASLSDWNPETCNRYVRYDGAIVLVGINIAGLIMFLRVRVVFYNRKSVVYPVALLLALEFAVNAWLLSRGTSAVHLGPRWPCFMVFESKIRRIATASGWLPLLYFTVVTVLIVYKVGKEYREYPFTSGFSGTILVEVIIYYRVIFAVTLALAIMTAAAPYGMQGVTAQLELVLVVTMMSRISIDLKKRIDIHDSRGAREGVDKEDPYYYQSSNIHFRDIVIGETRYRNPTRRPREFAFIQNSGDPDATVNCPLCDALDPPR